MSKMKSHLAAAIFTAAFLMAGAIVTLDEARAAQCAPVSMVVSQLTERYNEQVIARGVSSSDTLILIFVSDAGTWTIAEVDTSGSACLRAAGSGFEQAIQKPLLDPKGNELGT